LQERNTEIVVSDPLADENMREVYPTIECAENAAATLQNAALVVTDWEKTRRPTSRENLPNRR
jgi:hypothetical protein